MRDYRMCHSRELHTCTIPGKQYPFTSADLVRMWLVYSEATPSASMYLAMLQTIIVARARCFVTKSSVFVFKGTSVYML